MIFVRIQGNTIEFSHNGLRALNRREFGRLCGRVANYNLEGPWGHMAEPVGRGITGTSHMDWCRVAQIELSMLLSLFLWQTSRKGISLGQSFVHARSCLDKRLQGERDGYGGRLLLNPNDGRLKNARG